jgi:hypothetical protein
MVLAIIAGWSRACAFAMWSLAKVVVLVLCVSRRIEIKTLRLFIDAFIGALF